MCQDTVSIEYRNKNKNKNKNNSGSEDAAPSPFKYLLGTFFQLHREAKGFDPPWSGREGSLLKADIQRMQTLEKSGDNWVKVFAGLMQMFFKDKVPKVAKFCSEAGYTYGVFHSQIDSMMAWLDKA